MVFKFTGLHKFYLKEIKFLKYLYLNQINVPSKRKTPTFFVLFVQKLNKLNLLDINDFNHIN